MKVDVNPVEYLISNGQENHLVQYFYHIFKLWLGALIPRSVSVSVYLSVCLSFCLLVCLSAGPSVCPPKIIEKITKRYKTLQILHNSQNLANHVKHKKGYF